jgi:GalNAc-alpha-(1->4)-GalNAc-alpha-(1->3)-diNAcBac-PP-undecaprenol alpha-1,4-N-acetyl-D-galactosaminyltransferase
MAGGKVRKLCLVIPSLQAGGMERVMSELAGYFAVKEYIEIHLVLYGISRQIFYPIPDNIIIYKPHFGFNNKWRLFFTLKTLFYLRKTVKKIEPDSILSFGELWNSFVLLSLFGLKYPVYISDRCSPEKRFNAYHTFLRKILYPRAKGIIAQTKKACEIYSKKFNHRNISIIGNPIREIKDTGKTEKQNIVLMVGRLIKSKNQDKLIELFLKIRIPGWRLIIVGYDHLQQKNSEHLQAIITRNKAEDKVLLVGKQADVESYYTMSKIFAFTSSSEGFPNVLGEAMTAGLPAIAFDCVAGPSEMIKDNYNGFLIPLFDYKQFQDKLEILMKDEKLRYSFGKNAKVDIRQFSITRIGEQYLRFILN